MTRTLLAWTCGLVVSLPTSIRAEDWPEFRGPTGQGLVRDGALPLQWGPDKNVVWKTAIPGRGWSSPIVCAGRVYLTTATAVGNSSANDVSLRALCLDAKNGKILWDKEVFRLDARRAGRMHSKNSLASPTPLVQDGRLYVHFGHLGTACLDLEGKVLWRNTDLAYSPVHGNGGSPVLVDKAIVFSCDGASNPFIVALDRDKGKVLWKTPRSVDAYKKFSFGTPLVITVKGQKQIISTGSEMVGAYDPATGKEIWRVGYDGYSLVPRPVFGHGLLFLSSGFDSPVLLAIRPDGRGDVTKTHIAWTSRKAAPLTPSPLLVSEELYTVSDRGIASCMDARTGQVHWQQRIGGSYSASPIHAAGKIYFQSEDGTGVVVQAGKEFKVLAKNALRERTLASYAAVKGALFIRTEKHLYRIEER
jgi:outer membrane protein assembly factor BamB